MATTASARRYAQAVFEIALKGSEMDKWREEIGLIARAAVYPGVHAILESPRVPFANKQDLLRKLLPSLSPLGMNLAYVVVKAGQLGILDRMADIYGDTVDSHKGIVHAEVVTMLPLEDDDKRFVSDWLGKLSGKTVVLEARTDADILGGLVVRMGDQVIDASVRTRLDRLKRNLLKVGSPA